MSAELSLLCRRCGLCCDGTLFTRAPLEPDEVEPLRARGLPIAPPTERARSPGLGQPCAALDGTCCTIYLERPASCRRYECLLYRALAEGEVDLAEAIETVERARDLVRRGDPAAGPLLDNRFRGSAPRL